MDCNHARLLLFFSHNKAELDNIEVDALRSHLEQCPECDALAKAERDQDGVVGRAMRAVPIPEHLEEKIFQKLAVQRRLRLRRSATAAGAIAAMLMIGLGVGWYFLSARPEVSWITLETISEELSENVALAADPSQTADKVEQWFHDKGLTMEAPRNLNYGLLKNFEVAQFKNRRVAKLVFVGNDRGQVAIAEVLVLSESQFNLAELKNDLENGKELRLPGSGFTLHVTPSPGGSIFLMILRGGSLDLFNHQPDA